MYFVATVGIDKGLMHNGTALNDERLHVVLVQLREQLRDGLMPMQHKAARVFAPPKARIQCGMFAFVGGFAHQNGIALSP